MSDVSRAQARWSRSDKVFSARLLIPNLRFIRSHYGPDAEAELYRRIGMTPEELEDPDLWCPYDLSVAMNEAMVDITGDPEVMYRAGLYSAMTAELGPWLLLGRQLASPRDIYARLPAMTGDFTKVTHFDLLELGKREALIRFRVDPPFPDDPLFDQKRRGTLASFPMGLGLPPATVVEEQCLHRGDPACVYRVRWQGGERRLAMFGAGLGSLLFLGGLTGHLLLGRPLMGALLAGLAALLGFLAFALAPLLGARRDSSRQDLQQLEAHLARSRSQTEQLQLLAEISMSLHQNHDQRALVDTAADLVRRYLRFDRVVFWMLEDGRLEAITGSGLEPDLARRLQDLWLPRAPDRPSSSDTVLFGSLLERGEGALVTDLARWKSHLSPRGQALFDLVAPGPFAAAPVLSEGKRLGILAADRSLSGAKVDDGDLKMLEQVARQLGLALENVRLLDREREACARREEALLLERKLSLYLQPHVVEELRRSSEATVPAMQETVAILFVDVVGFSRVSERLPEQEVLAWLNVLFTEGDRVVHLHEGIIDKRLGDGILAVFRGGSGGESAPARALASASELHRVVASKDELLEARGLPPLRVRSGITYGEVISGTIGTEVRYEYTVLGRTVNLAQRLQTLAHPGQTAISPEAWEVAGCPAAREEEEARVHGIPEPVRFRRVTHLGDGPKMNLAARASEA